MQGAGPPMEGLRSAATHTSAPQFTPARRALGLTSGQGAPSEFAKGRFDWQKGMHAAGGTHTLRQVSRVAHTSRPTSASSMPGHVKEDCNAQMGGSALLEVQPADNVSYLFGSGGGGDCILPRLNPPHKTFPSTSPT